MKTLLLLFTNGDIDLPTEVLLEIQHASSNVDGKAVTFGEPLPAHNCGYYKQEQVVQQSFQTFMSQRGCAEWLRLKKDEDVSITEELVEANVGGVDLKAYKPLKFEDYSSKNVQIPSQDLLKQNTGFLKWYLKNPNAAAGFKILTTLQLPAAVDNKALEYWLANL